jgi:hypothetical protein
MKRNLILLPILFLSLSAWAQENAFTLGGGYAFATVEDSDTKLSGYRINGLYEFNPAGGKVAHGFSIGYIGMSGSEGNQDIKVNSLPIYYAPKFLFGSDKAKGFLKGALGMQFSSLKREGPLLDLSDSDFGFYGGFGAGGMYLVNEKVFLSAEYEIAWLSNGYYNDGWVNSINAGVGFKF